MTNSLESGQSSEQRIEQLFPCGESQSNLSSGFPSKWSHPMFGAFERPLPQARSARSARFAGALEKHLEDLEAIHRAVGIYVALAPPEEPKQRQGVRTLLTPEGSPPNPCHAVGYVGATSLGDWAQMPRGRGKNRPSVECNENPCQKKGKKGAPLGNWV